ACDDTASGSDTDELNIFDLTVKEAEIVDGNSSWTLTWYATDDPTLLNDTTLINDPSAFTNTENEQTITVEVTDSNGCSALTTLTLVVNPLPSPT
ncbi:hypothetical protein, partial [Haloflavibacter putidus]|uniref:hypothetical protein n=1 Tax=Haloflavibacter putidus TaxID=2576776 RepID=UPI001F2B0552